MATLTISEKTTGGGTDFHAQVYMPERITVRKLICLYVDHQIEHSATDASARRSYFLPAQVEQELNDDKPARGPRVDADQMHERALNAFQNNQIVLLVDEQQVDDLDEEVLLRIDSAVTFLRLTPLVGG